VKYGWLQFFIGLYILLRFLQGIDFLKFFGYGWLSENGRTKKQEYLDVSLTEECASYYLHQADWRQPGER